MKKKIYLKKSIRIILILVLLGIFIFSSFKVFNYYSDTHKNNKENKNLIEEVIKEVPTDDNSGEIKTKIGRASCRERVFQRV